MSNANDAMAFLHSTEHDVELNELLEKASDFCVSFQEALYDIKMYLDRLQENEKEMQERLR